MNDELILCTPELERLKIYLATVAAGNAKSRTAREANESRVRRIFRAPYTKEELQNTPWTGRRLVNVVNE